MADRALRLVFRQDDAGVSLKSATQINTRSPLALPDTLGPQATGLFAELRSEDGRALHTRTLAMDEARTIEYPTGDPDQEFGRAQSTEPVLVSVVVPADREARSVALVRAMPRNYIASFFASGPRRQELAVYPIPADGGE